MRAALKVIFLDFDGVITTEASHWNLSFEKMQLVKRIVDDTDAKIVISSSWRRYTLEKTIESITDPNNPFVKSNPFLIPEVVVGITGRMYAFKYGIAEKHYRVCRGVEIQQYLDEHPDIENYIILDDSTDMLLSQNSKFIQTDPKSGISEKDVERAIRILNGSTSQKEEMEQGEKDAEEMEQQICDNCKEICNYHQYIHVRGYNRNQYKGDRCDELKERLNRINI